MQTRTKAMISKQNDFNARVSYINKTLSDTDTIIKTFTPWSLVFDGLESAQPDQISLQHISLARQKDTTILRISGNAQARNDLLTYQQSLKALPFVAEIESPIENLIATKNITFQLQLKLNPHIFSK